MSCRLYPPGDPRGEAAAVVWPAAHSHRGAPPNSPAGKAGAAPEPPLAPPRDFDRELRDARAAGFREGETAGRTRAAGEMQPVLERLAATTAEIGSLRARLRREAEADMLQLALAIAHRILRRELSLDPEALHGLVLAALEKLEGQEIARLRVHPTQAAGIANLLRQNGTAVEVTPDPSLAPGAALFETPRGSLDASIETQLQEIERGLADTLRRRS
jgi:flagellar assembly protein FliH